MDLQRTTTCAPSGARVAVILVTALALVLGQGVMVAQGTWESMLRPDLVSMSYTGDAPDDDSWDPRISGDGRYIVYTSEANDITIDDEDTDGQEGELDVFRYDRINGETVLVSQSSSTTETVDRGSRDPRISDDGRYVLFFTGYGFVPEDVNDGQDLYVKDMETGEFRWIDFYGDGEALTNNVYEWELSGDGSYVVFEAWNGDLLGTGRTTESRNIWGYDLESDEATLVSVPADSGTATRGSRDPWISDDGNSVVFLTGNSWDAADTNDDQDFYIRDLTTGLMRWVDVAGDGSPVGRYNWEARISGDGSTIAWLSETDLLPDDTNGRDDIYAYDLVSNEATLVSGPAVDDRGSREPQLSYDGDTILIYSGQAFVPEDTNGDQDMYLKDLVTGEFTRIPIMGEMALPGNDIDYISMSDDAVHVAFESDVDLIPADNNNDNEDIYHATTVVNSLSDGATRLAGGTRYTTAVDVSEQAFPFGADTVVIATGDDWPDALGGAALAGAVDGPVLLTHSDWLDASTSAELLRLGARNVYLLGGYAAVSPAVETQLEMMLPGFVWRIGGPDRYATSKAVANRTVEVLGSEFDGKACVATGMNFPDAVGAAPLGAGLGWPVLLVRPSDPSVLLPPSTDSVVILGGEDAVGPAVETFLEGELGDTEVDREGGADRYETSAMLAQYGVDHGLLWDGVGISSGTNFPDALTGGAALGLYRTTLLLTRPTDLSAPAAEKLTDNAAEIEDVTFLGGTAAISTTVENQVRAILGL